MKGTAKAENAVESPKNNYTFFGNNLTECYFEQSDLYKSPITQYNPSKIEKKLVVMLILEGPYFHQDFSSDQCNNYSEADLEINLSMNGARRNIRKKNR